MPLHYPCPEQARYIGHLNNEVAEFEIESPTRSGNDGTPDVLNLLIGTQDDGRWEFCCIEAPGRCPEWMEMKFVHDQCWDAEDACQQLHPPQSRYVNASEFALWIWRPTFCEVPQPPLWRERQMLAER